ARPGAVEPGIGRLELRFFDVPISLAGAFRDRHLDAVSGLDPAAAAALGEVPGSRLLREPATTLTAVALNLRPSRPQFSDARTRAALLDAIDRSRILTVAYDGLGTRADGLVPPSSWAFDPAASPAIRRDLKAAARALTAAGWTKAKDGWHAGKAAAPQDPTPDDLLEAARRPGAEDARKAAFSAVQKRLTAGSYVLPIAWPDAVVVLGNRVQGTENRAIADGSERFWDVLDWRLADDR